MTAAGSRSAGSGWQMRHACQPRVDEGAAAAGSLQVIRAPSR